MDSRHHRNAEVDGLTRNTNLEPPVLGDSLLSDIKFSHNFHPRQDSAVKLLVDGPHGLLQGSVDSIFDINGIVLSLKMNVAGPPLQRRIDHRVDQPNHWANITG